MCGNTGRSANRCRIATCRTQHAFNGATVSVVARTRGDPNALADTLRRLEAILSDSAAAPWFGTLVSVFAVLPVSFAMAGVYGVMAYAVGQRSNEVGLRMALGATGRSVLRLVLRQGLALAGVGVVLGLVAAAINTRLLKSMLFGVQPKDPAVYVAVAALPAVVALIASMFRLGGHPEMSARCVTAGIGL